VISRLGLRYVAVVVAVATAADVVAAAAAVDIVAAATFAAIG
jgi:hypothetical protein